MTPEKLFKLIGDIARNPYSFSHEDIAAVLFNNSYLLQQALLAYMEKENGRH